VLRVPFAVTTSAIILLAAATGHSQAASDRTLAESLFGEARELMDQKRYDEACPKLAESQRLDPGGGTLLNLALCHELQGRTATAWGEYREALALARADRRPDRIQFAEEHLKALEPRLSRLTLKVPADARVDGLVLKLDGGELREPLWSSALPVDPGERVLEATAPGRATWKARITVDPGARVEQLVPILEPLPDAKPGAPELATPSEPTERATGGGNQELLGYSVGGLGVVALSIGGYFGIRAIQERSASDDECPDGRCTAEGVRRNESAQSFATFANIGIGIGLLAVGIGGYLVLTADDGPEKEMARTPAVRVGAAALPGRAELALEATF
jgi:hypothetical protein